MEIFSCVTLEQRVPGDHPLREIRRLTDVVLRSLSVEFDQLYSAFRRPSIAPEYVLRALLLQAFYSVRSERQLVEQLDYNLLFRWFVGLGMALLRGPRLDQRAIHSEVLVAHEALSLPVHFGEEALRHLGELVPSPSSLPSFLRKLARCAPLLRRRGGSAQGDTIDSLDRYMCPFEMQDMRATLGTGQVCAAALAEHRPGRRGSEEKGIVFTAEGTTVSERTTVDVATEQAGKAHSRRTWTKGCSVMQFGQKA